MSRSLHRGTWELGIVVCLGITGACVPSGNYVLAQLRPDNTLGAKSSFVTPQNPLTDRIDGGAIRGANLFHSFLEFNVDEGRGVYFSNPSGIENI
jgi:large exoprotein involved in heme utilization and adhesion